MSQLVRLVLICSTFGLAQLQGCSLDANTAKQVARSPIVGENTFFGFVLPVHSPNVSSGVVCGPISYESIIKVEAFFWALRTFEDRYPGETASQSGLVFDSCGSPDRSYQLMAPVEFDKASMNVLAYLVADSHSVAVRTSKLSAPRDATVISAAVNDPGTPSTENFYHLSPTAQQESTAILKLLDKAGWRYVQVLYSNDGYGRAVYKAFLENGKMYDVTIGRSLMLAEEEPTPDLDTHDFVVVIFAYPAQKVKVYRDLGENNFIFVTTNFGPVLPEGDGKEYNSRIVELRSAFKMQFNVSSVKFMTDVVQKLTSTGTGNTQNPWYADFWEGMNKCDISGAGDPDYNQPCNTTMTLGDALSVDQDGVALIIQGVDLMLKALKLSCPTVCPVDTLQNRRKSFNTHFQQVGIEADQAFDKDTLGPAIWEYRVFLIERDGNKFTENEIGTVEMSSVNLNGLTDLEVVRSKNTGGSRVVVRPVEAEEYYPTRFDAWGYIWVIVIGVLASLGIILVFIISILLCVLMGKGAMSNFVWLYAVLLFGALLGYLTLFAYIPVPTKATCGIIRFGVGISYGICFAVMVVLGLLLCKKSEMFSSTRVSNIFIAVTLILLITVEVVILVTWLIWTPPGVSYALFNGFQLPRRICNHYTLGPGNTFFRTVFENHLLHLIYIMFLILLVLLMAIFIFMRRNNLRASRNKNESYALLAAGIGTGLGTVAIWLVWTLVGALAGTTYNDVNNYGDAAMAFGLWFTLTWLLVFLLVQIVNTWRGSSSKVKKTHNEIKVNLANMNSEHTKGQSYNSGISTVDGKVIQERHEHRENHEQLNKVPLILLPNGGNAVTSYEQHVETRTEKSHFRPPPLPENEAVHHQEHVFNRGSNFCAECRFEHDPNALHLRHPKTDLGLSSHDTSFEQSTVHRVRGVESGVYEPRMATSLQALHLLHPRSRPVSRAGSLDGGRRLVVHGGNTRVARSEIGYGSSHGAFHGSHNGPNIIDLRRPRHFDRAYYYPSNQYSNVYITEKGTSVI